MFQVPSSNKLLIFHANLFTDNQWQEAVFEKCIKSEDKKFTAEKGNLIVDHRGNAVSNFFKSIGDLHDDVILLIRPESFWVLLSCANYGFCFSKQWLELEYQKKKQSKKDYRQLVGTLFRKINNQLVITSGFPTVNFRKW